MKSIITMVAVCSLIIASSSSADENVKLIDGSCSQLSISHLDQTTKSFVGEIVVVKNQQCYLYGASLGEKCKAYKEQIDSLSSLPITDEGKKKKIVSVKVEPACFITLPKPNDCAKDRAVRRYHFSLYQRYVMCMNSPFWKEINCHTIWIDGHPHEQCQRVDVPLPAGCDTLTNTYHGYGGGNPTPEQSADNLAEARRNDVCQDIPGWSH